MNKKIRLLLVDDEEEFVKTLAERLELRGFKTLIALNGGEALEILETEEVDIIILDLKMPGISGLDLLRTIRHEKNNIPVILLTGHGETKDGIQGMKLGAFEYLMKPIEIDMLLQKIGEAYEEKHL